MRNIRVFPPTSGPFSTNPTSVFGRNYSPTAATYADVSESDGAALEANGWTICTGYVGTTAQRPFANDPSTPSLSGRALPKGMPYLDTTIGAHILWDGAAWRNPVNGTAV